jgi:hypothetical protein
MPNPKRPKLCKLCGANPATVPDHDSGSRRPVPTICRDCREEQVNRALERASSRWRDGR